MSAVVYSSVGHRDADDEQAPGHAAQSRDLRTQVVSWVSGIVISWFYPVLQRGWSHPLQQDDLLPLPPHLTCATAYRLLINVLRASRRTATQGKEVPVDQSGSKQPTDSPELELRNSRSLLRTIWQLHKRRLIFALVGIYTYQGLVFWQPLLLKGLVEALLAARDASSVPQAIWFYPLGLFATPLLGSLFKAQSMLAMIDVQICMRTQLSCAVYQKVLRLSTGARQRMPSGRVVNLMSADVAKICDFLYPQFSFMCIAPLAIAGSLILLWFQIGWATFIGLAVLMLSSPVSHYSVMATRRFRSIMLQHADERVKLVNQFLMGVRVIKMYAWEPAQQGEINRARKHELHAFRQMIPARVANQTLLYTLPQLAGVLSFFVVGMTQPEKLKAGAVFSSLVLFNIMRFPLLSISTSLVELGAAIISAQRLTDFFAAEEREDYVERHAEPREQAIAVSRASFIWASPDPHVAVQHKATSAKSANGSAAPSWIALPQRKRGYSRLDQHNEGADGPGEDEGATPAAGAGAHGANGHGTNGLTSSSSSNRFFQLQDINLEVHSGELVCVVGRVGSGKTSLVNAILGEMHKTSGSVAISGSVAYVAQTAWIMNGSVVENVCMGLPLDPERWRLVVEACALGPDLELLPAGAQTEIGEKGVNLSGGQKQRLALARAVYQQADVYIMDDPLSAVDVHVGGHIFQHCVRELLGRSAVLLVTNGVQYLPQANRVVVMADGGILLQGSYQHCLSSPKFAAMLEEFDSAREDPAEEQPTTNTNTTSNTTAKQPPPQPQPPPRAGRPKAPGTATVEHIASTGSINSMVEGGAAGPSSPLALRHTPADVDPQAQGPPQEKGGGGGGAEGRLIKKEDRELGQVKGRVYSSYFRAYGLLAAAAMVTLWSCEQTSRILTNTLLAAWSKAETLSDGSKSSSLYPMVYLGLAGVYSLAVLLRSTTNNLSGYRASGIIHRNMLDCLIRAPVSFFETTPIGRILNRLSRDVDEMDYNLAMYVQQFGNCIMRMVATLTFLCVIQPGFIGAVLPLACIYFFLQRFFRRSSIELQRLVAVSGSPVYANFSETMAGLDTIRAYAFQDRFIQRHEDKVDANNSGFFMARVADEWLSIRLDGIGACIVLSVASMAIYFRHRLPPALIALSLSESIDLTAFLNYAVKVAAMVESRFNAVERLLAFSVLDSEAPWEAGRTRGGPKLLGDKKGAPADWPQHGRLDVQDIWMRYRPELDPVLKGVSFKVASGEKLGIVGRTGSGKSSVIVALFRIVEPERGRVLLDGVDLLHLGLHEVRRAIAAIPQEPVLFSGPMRRNLDANAAFSDVQIWEALQHVGLAEHVRDAGGLDAVVSENGENLSLGQRQLICVARALLRRPKVLVADEATASVDVETDGLIQRTIRSQFSSCTVLTIAHRLNTILDSSKVLLLEAGRVEEFGTTAQLLADHDSKFRAMCEGAGLVEQQR